MTDLAEDRFHEYKGKVARFGFSEGHEGIPLSDPLPTRIPVLTEEMGIWNHKEPRDGQGIKFDENAVRLAFPSEEKKA